MRLLLLSLASSLALHQRSSPATRLSPLAHTRCAAHASMLTLSSQAQPSAAARTVSVSMTGNDDWDGEKSGSSSKPDLFVPVLVGLSFGGYALIVLYDVFFGNGLCGLTVQCSSSPWG